MPWFGVAVIATAVAKTLPLVAGTIVIAMLVMFGVADEGDVIDRAEIEQFEQVILVGLGVIMAGVSALLVSLVSFRRRWRTPFIVVSTLLAVVDGSVLFAGVAGSGPASPPDTIVGAVLLAQIAIAVHAWRLPARAPSSAIG